MIGFVIAGGLLLAKAVIKYPKLFEAPPEGQPPPWHVRSVLFLTCTGVSFAHGSNDGQKGMGLVMLILVGVLPQLYAVDINLKADDVAALGAMNRAVSAIIEKRGGPSAPVTPMSKSGAAQLSNPPAASMETVLKASSGDDKNEAVISDYINSSKKLDRATYAAVSAKNNTIAKRATAIERSAGRGSNGVADRHLSCLKRASPVLRPSFRSVLSGALKRQGRVTLGHLSGFDHAA